MEKREILKNDIVRKRMRGANFYKRNVKIIKNISFVLCIPVNGFSSDKIQKIRDNLLKYGYTVDKFTTNSFISYLKNNNIFLEKKTLSSFYIGHTLVVSIYKEKVKEKEKTDNFYFRYEQTFERKQLNFLCKYILHTNIKYANLIYIYSDYNKMKKLVITQLSVENINSISKNLDIYDKKEFTFINIQTAIYSFISVLFQYKVILLNLLVKYNNIKNNNNNINSQNANI